MEIYLVCGNGFEWEDLIVFLIKDDAIDYSKKHPNVRLEIFKMDDTCLGYKPTYVYYQNGEYIEFNENR